MFENPPKNNHSVTAPGAQILLGGDDAQSFETPRKKIRVSLHQVPILFWYLIQYYVYTRTKLIGQFRNSLCPEYIIFFQMDGKSAHAAQCNKSRASTKVIDSIIEIHSFDQKRVIIKGLLQLK